MSLWNLLVVVTAVSAFILLTQRCLYALAAVIASGVAVLLAFEVITISRQDSVPLMLATISCAVGVVAYVRSDQKNAIGSAAVLAAVSGVQIIKLLELL